MENFNLRDVAIIWGFAVLFLLIGLVGGKFKFRGTEISNQIPWPFRIVALFFASIMFCGPFMWVIFITFYSNPPTTSIPPLIDTPIPVIDVPVSATQIPTQIIPTQIVPTPIFEQLDPVLKGYGTTIWNHPDGYVIFTIDAIGNQTYRDFDLSNTLLSEGFWATDDSFSPPVLRLDGFNYAAGTTYVGRFDVYDNYMDGGVSVDGVNFNSLRLTFTP